MLSTSVTFFHSNPDAAINHPSATDRPDPHPVRSSYLSARGFLRNATSTEDYLYALKGLMAAVGTGPESRQGAQESFMGMGVPVKWVKQQLPGSERVYQVRIRNTVGRVGVAG